MPIDKDEILQNIALGGAANADAVAIKAIIATRVHLSQVTNYSGGSLRFTRPFELALTIPQSLKTINPFNIRCCFCRKVIVFPAWYRVHKFSINHFHFFVCCNADKINTSCLKGAI